MIQFGHGPVFRDLNFNEDRTAASEIVAMILRINFHSRTKVRGACALRGLKQLERRSLGRATRVRVAEILGRCCGLDGFYPIDALAAVYAIEMKLCDWAHAAAWVAKDGKLWGGWFGPDALLVGLKREAAGERIGPRGDHERAQRLQVKIRTERVQSLARYRSRPDGGGRWPICATR